jgi:hypothetical protein
MHRTIFYFHEWLVHARTAARTRDLSRSKKRS